MRFENFELIEDCLTLYFTCEYRTKPLTSQNKVTVGMSLSRLIFNLVSSLPNDGRDGWKATSPIWLPDHKCYQKLRLRHCNFPLTASGARATPFCSSSDRP